MKIIYFFTLLFPFFGCSNPNAEKKEGATLATDTVQMEPIKKGIVSRAVVSNDNTNSYCIYLPTSYDSTKKYTTFIFFDAHGSGYLPIEKYKSIAEKWGFIFVGSNSSKNGMLVEQTLNIGNALIEELINKVAVDENNITLCGFSGGARVAANIAKANNSIKGIICNSAAPQSQIKDKIVIGLAGLGDMNYLELKKFNSHPQTNDFVNELLVFNGAHEWAPTDLMEDAMLLATIHHPTIVKTFSDTIMAKALSENIMRQADTMQEISCLVVSSYLEIGIKYTREFKEAEKLINRLDRLRNATCFNTDVAAWLNAETEENKLQQELGNAVLSQDSSWWKNNESHYFESPKAGADLFMRQRLRGYVSLMCYSYANQALKTNNTMAAEKFITVYSIVDPTNCEWAYMKSTLYLKVGLKENAIALLEKAIELGFKDQSRLNNDANFNSLKTNSKFLELLEKTN